MIEVKILTKRYKKQLALNQFSHEFIPGKIYGIVGPNGSGKSTLIKSLIGALVPTQGSITSENFLAGYLPETYDLPLNLSGNQLLQNQSRLMGSTRESIQELPPVSLFNMKQYLNRKIATYSKGQMKKIGIARAMVGAPDMLLLDEPFEALDTLDRSRLSKLLTGYAGNGKMIILSTHILFELDSLCEEIIFLKEGRKLFAIDTTDLCNLRLVEVNEKGDAHRVKVLTHCDSLEEQADSEGAGIKLIKNGISLSDLYTIYYQ